MAMPAWREYLTLKIFNIFVFLWYTAANFFIFTLAWNLEKDVPQRWGYGAGKETYLTPTPWIYGVLFIIHLLFAGTILYMQWTERGNELIIEDLGLQFPLLLILSTLWAGTWARQLPIPSFILAILVALVASNIFLTFKKRYPLAADSDWTERVFVHIPFSLYHGWTVFILFVNGFSAFAPDYLTSGTVAKVFAVWLLAILCGISLSYAISTQGGDIAGTLVITLGFFAIYAHSHIHGRYHNQPEWMRWTTLVFGVISLFATVKSAVGTWEIWRGGQIRLDEVGGQTV